MPEITVQELQQMKDSREQFFLLDVRRPEEHAFSNIEGTVIPLDELSARMNELDPYRDDRMIVYCRSGARSARAVHFLRAMGFDAYNLKGGIIAWSKDIDPAVPTY